jgi:ERF superfamily
MQERILARNAETAFNASMKAAQESMPRIKRDRENTSTNSLYATLESVNHVVVPVYTQHGFALSFGTADCPTAGRIRIVCDVVHERGHSKRYQADIPEDATGLKGNPNKTATHAYGSSMSYGRRYLTLLIFNVSLTNEDDDGNTAGGMITEDQVASLEADIIRLGVNRAAFIAYMCIDELSQILACNFEKAVARLHEKGPRPDTSGVDLAIRDRWIGRIVDTLNQDKDEYGIADDMREINMELSQFDALYVTVFDELAKRKILTKANYRKWLAIRRPQQ